MTAHQDLTVRPAAPADHPVLERLWPLFRHDLADLQNLLPNPDGGYPDTRLRHALSGDPDWAAYLLVVRERPAGFAFVRALTGPAAVMNSFFVVRGARGTGIGLRAAHEVIARHPGRWEIAFQDRNTGAVRFWRRVATGVAGTAWSEEHRTVPGRPESPPDSWISFEAPAPPERTDDRAEA